MSYMQIGVLVKVKISAGGGGEIQAERTIDMGINYAHQEVQATVSGDTGMYALLLMLNHTTGDTVVAGISVPMSPSDPSCVVIQIILHRVKQSGTVDARLRVRGWLGTHQQPNQHWAHTDQPGESHYVRHAVQQPTCHTCSWSQFRAHNIVDLVTKSKQLGRYAAKAWQVEDGWAYISNPVTFEVDVATKGLANPQVFPKDSQQCSAH